MAAFADRKASDQGDGLRLTGGSWIDAIFRQRYCRMPIPMLNRHTPHARHVRQDKWCLSSI